MEERSKLTSAETIAIPAVSSGSGRQYADEGRFIPGTLLGGRYRVIGLLGKGGMGEVYRATDLTLGQSVALKFLPESAAASERLLERFQGEVRVARQVSHPNVCRVYDIGEVEGEGRADATPVAALGPHPERGQLGGLHPRPDADRGRLAPGLAEVRLLVRRHVDGEQRGLPLRTTPRVRQEPEGDLGTERQVDRRVDRPGGQNDSPVSSS